jgi:small subunit ribosomal protein S17
MVKKNIGIGVKAPKGTCEDRKCPFHGELSVRGKSFKGMVTKRAFHKDATIEWVRSRPIAKYERYTIRRSSAKAYNPTCINAEKGDRVMIMQCRPLSKTKHFVIVENLGKDELFAEREGALEEGKFKATKKEQENKAKDEAEEEQAELAAKAEKPKSDDKKGEDSE